MSSDREALERTFDTRWRQCGGPDLTPQYRFAAEAVGGPGKGLRARLAEAGLADWRFDRAYLPAKIAIEIDGGTWGKRDENGEIVLGRHSRGTGFAGDCWKINNAQLLGWRVFRFTSDMLAKDPFGHLMPVVKLVLEAENAEQV